MGSTYRAHTCLRNARPKAFGRITWFPDRPDVMARYRVTLRADKARYPLLRSNGNLVSQNDLPEGRH